MYYLPCSGEYAKWNGGSGGNIYYSTKLAEFNVLPRQATYIFDKETLPENPAVDQTVKVTVKDADGNLITGGTLYYTVTFYNNLGSFVDSLSGSSTDSNNDGVYEITIPYDKLSTPGYAEFNVYLVGPASAS